jgi:hypothetical protein
MNLSFAAAAFVGVFAACFDAAKRVLGIAFPAGE